MKAKNEKIINTITRATEIAIAVVLSSLLLFILRIAESSAEGKLKLISESASDV